MCDCAHVEAGLRTFDKSAPYPEEITVKQIAEEIIEITNSTSKIIYQDLPIDDPKVRQPDITKAKVKLEWSPKVDRKKGLRITMEYFKNKIMNNNLV